MTSLEFPPDRMATKRSSTRGARIGLLFVMTTMSLLSTGCVTLSYKVGNMPMMPAHEVPKSILGRPKSEMQQISISRLRQQPPKTHRIDTGDILGIYIEHVLGQEGESPPVHFPERGDRAPALGYPVPVREDGTIALPYITPVSVRGLSLAEATEAIKKVYTEKQIVPENRINSIVTLIRSRTYRVEVIREESGGSQGVTKRGTGQTIDLPAYENDLLHALNATGGLPGVDAKSDIYIIRGSFQEGVQRDELVSSLLSCKQPCQCPNPLPDDPHVTRVPLRFFPEDLPTFDEEDIILQTGDVVYIPTRDAEKFYTGGVMPGGEFEIPRDYDLDVLGAIAIAKGQLGSGGTGLIRVGSQSAIANTGSGVGSTGKSPTDLIIVRKLPCGNQLPIKVDINRALQDPSHRILVQPGDTLILRYKLHEELTNAALGLIQFNYFLNNIGN